MHEKWSLLFRIVNCLEQKFSFLFKIHFLVRMHQTTTTKTKSLPIRPTMATLILAQYNNQPIISHKIIANSLCNFIMVDCYLAAFSRIWYNCLTMAMLTMTIAVSRRQSK
jgi:hypothetical protein